MSIDAPPRGPKPRRWLLRILLAGTIALALSLGGVVSLSKPFQDGSTRLFGKVVDGVKDHPRATIVLCVGGVALLWLGIGALAAGQEWKVHRPLGRRRDARPSASIPPVE
ncbi:MAG: hypothetical protein L0211_25170 [Planctomycetaceae bacterium]|nr:hypothetical protein [Planctomycetaceae bacterium]